MSAPARDGVAMAEAAAPAQYLTFKIAGESYAVGILRVREILQYESVTKVPSTPRSIRGVMNLRGSVVPVVDLAIKFGMPESVLTPRTCVVILEVESDEERMIMGVMADSVSEVIELRSDDIEPPPPFGAKVKVDYLVGMGKADKKFLLVLDIDQVLSAEDLTAASRAEDEFTNGAAAIQDAAAPGQGLVPSEAAAPASSPPRKPRAERKPTAKAGRTKTRQKKTVANLQEPTDGPESQG